DLRARRTDRSHGRQGRAAEEGGRRDNAPLDESCARVPAASTARSEALTRDDRRGRAGVRSGRSGTTTRAVPGHAAVGGRDVPAHGDARLDRASAATAAAEAPRHAVARAHPRDDRARPARVLAGALTMDLDVHLTAIMSGDKLSF